MKHSPGRRTLLGAAALSCVAGASAPVQAGVRTSAHIVIAGAGLGGIAVANRLAALLDGAKITIVDSKEEHNYQPGYTLVATVCGRWTRCATAMPNLQPARR
jgi:sulfide:quinone oxidoreductase